MRKIIHIDMDAFFASIEQRDNPELRGKPVAVGYAGKRGVVAAASYEARRYGVRSAMPSVIALKRCPHLIFVPVRFDVYREVSSQIMSIFLDYTDLVEPLSIDEAFLDITENYIKMPSATLIAKEIRQRIRDETSLTASAGVSKNKFLAKIASDYNKPDGLFVIEPKDAESFVAALSIEKFHGVGKVTAEKMHRLGIHTGADMRKFGLVNLVRNFGKAGESYYDFSRGVDLREVTPDRIRKSIGAENTFLEDISELGQLLDELHKIAETVWRRSSRREFYGRTITLKVKYSDFEQITRSRTLPDFNRDFDTLWSIGRELMEQVDRSQRSIRLIGLTISNADISVLPKVYQLELDLDFDTPIFRVPR